MAVTPERIVVCGGYTQALDLLARVLAGRGATGLAAESFGLRAHREIAAARGLRLSQLAVDEHGAVTSALAGEGAVLLTPAHQFPLGVALHPRRRRSVVDWAAGTGAVVLEDDYDGEFRYDRQAIGALQALAPEHVVYAGTASKSLVPGLRLGWLVLPARLVDEVVSAKRAAGLLSSSIDQLTLAEFIASGGYDRQVRRARLGYRRRRDRLAHELARRAPRAQVTGIAAGLHALVTLPAGRSEAEVVADGAPPRSGAAGPRGLQPRRPAARARARSGLREPAAARVHHRARPAVRGPREGLSAQPCCSGGPAVMSSPVISAAATRIAAAQPAATA